MGRIHMEILKAMNLQKNYGIKENTTYALKGVSLSLQQGEFVAVVGTSGSGKSTLLNLIGGLDNPSQGEVWIRNKNITKMNKEELTIFRRRNIGYVFQNYNLVSILSVYENIVLPVELDGEIVDKEYLNELIQILGIQDKLDSMPRIYQVVNSNELQ
jgi:putative ABC transport system ATP-binding protein